MTDYNFGPTGQAIYDRTYSRPLPDGSKENWGQTVRRVAAGNLALVHGDSGYWSDEVWDEYQNLVLYMERFDIIPAGRHLWATGVKGRQYLFNCHVSHWTDRLSDHFEFTFLRLMEGGGVGSNYGSRYLKDYRVNRALAVHIVCDPEHPDYEDMKAAGVLSDEYTSDWEGAYVVDDSREGWSEALVDLLDTYTTDEPVRHAQRVYDVTNVRAKGARLKTFGGTASGPGPFARMMLDTEYAMNKAFIGQVFTPLTAMDIDHAIAECVVSGGSRRSARMSILPWDDPFIQEFISGKRDAGKWWTTNISVEVNDDFFEAMERQDPDATHVYMQAVEGMLTDGEPGLWNSSLSNVGEVNEVVSTNPCGEIALEPWENCNLGHVNLGNFANRTTGSLLMAHRLMTRFVMRATYGDVNDEKQAEKLASNRRIGVGHFGVQTYLNLRGERYSEAPYGYFPMELQEMYGIVRKEARNYAFELRIPEPVKVTTVAPTGTIAKLPGTTEGIHPIYSRYFIRRVRFTATDEDQWAQVMQAASDGMRVERDMYDSSGNTWIVEYPTKDLLVQQVEDAGYRSNIVESVDEISLEDMLAFQEMYQTYYADNAVSFTVNVPATGRQQEAMLAGETIPAPYPPKVDEVAQTMLEYLPNLKGTTMMVDGSRPQAPYERITEEKYWALGAGHVADSTDEDCFGGACPVR